MKAEEIKGLIDFIAKSGLDEVNVETEGFKISIKRSNITVQAVASPVATQTVEVQPITHTTPSVNQASVSTTEPTDSQDTQDEANYVSVKSPMIGTFYRAPNPETPVFVNVGDKISVGQTVCIIEAMKLFNEIESEVSGTIVKILVDNASPVEYDQPLFLVDPS